MSDDDDAVLIGAGTAALSRATYLFRLEVLNSATDLVERPRFRSYVDPGADAVLLYLRSRGDEDARVRMAGQLIFEALVDTDGLPHGYVAPPPTEADPEPEVDPRLHDRAQWSSRRRFVALIEAPHYRVHSSVIVELAETMVGKAFKRGGRPVVPTTSPSA